MPHLYWGNFNFESELAGHRRNPPLPLRRLDAELACCWLTVADDGDWIWCPEPMDPAFFQRMIDLGMPAVRPVSDVQEPADLERARGVRRTSTSVGLMELVPWGWSDRVRAFAERIGARIDAPPVGVVRRANSRRFSLACEMDWGVNPRGAAAVESMSQLEDALRRTAADDAPWVLKAEFSHAARERVLGSGPELIEDQARWAAKRLERDGILFLEPWLDRCAEVGIQWTVPRTGPPKLEGITPLLSDPCGRYLGSRFGEDPAPGDWGQAVETAERAVRELQSMGYSGPVGIDAMRYRDHNGDEQLRPLQDVNARWTMGRLSLGWRRLAESGVWRHGTREEFADARSVRPCVVTSPELVGSEMVGHVTWVERDAQAHRFD